MASATFNTDNSLPLWLLNITGNVNVFELPDALAVPGHIPGTSVFTPPANLSTGGPINKLQEMNVQRDQPLVFRFTWTQTGLLTVAPPCYNLNFKCQVLVETIGPGETPLIPTAVIPMIAGSGHTYTHDITLGGGGLPNPLHDGIYRIWGRFVLGMGTMPQTPVTALMDLGSVNVYTL